MANPKLNSDPLADQMNRELNAASPMLVGNPEVLRGILAGCGDCIKILDLDGRLQFMSEGGKRVMEVEDFDALKGCPWPDFWSGEGNAQAKDAVKAAQEGRTARFQNAANTAKGTPRFWDVQVSPIAGTDGRPSHILSISRDITEEWQLRELDRLALEKQSFLTAELTHRVKNTLATVIAIANQTFREQTFKDAREIFNSRLQSLGAAYNVLTQSSWDKGDIGKIIEGALAPYQTGPEIFKIEGPALAVSPNQSLTLALAINELATNAMKYGALSMPGGRVNISWRVNTFLNANAFRLEWRESNGPVVNAPTRTGFGTRLIKSMLAKDFGGTVELHFEPAGLNCILSCALPGSDPTPNASPRT